MRAGEPDRGRGHRRPSVRAARPATPRTRCAPGRGVPGAVGGPVFELPDLASVQAARAVPREHDRVGRAREGPPRRGVQAARSRVARSGPERGGARGNAVLGGPAPLAITAASTILQAHEPSTLHLPIAVPAGTEPPDAAVPAEGFGLLGRPEAAGRPSWLAALTAGPQPVLQQIVPRPVRGRAARRRKVAGAARAAANKPATKAAALAASAPGVQPAAPGTVPNASFRIGSKSRSASACGSCASPRPASRPVRACSNRPSPADRAVLSAADPPAARRRVLLLACRLELLRPARRTGR